MLRGIKGAAVLNVIGDYRQVHPNRFFHAGRRFLHEGRHVGQRLLGQPRFGNPLSTRELGSLLDQVKSTMLVTLWVYIGVEGAVVMSDKSDERTVSRATLLGFLLVTALYVLVSVLPFGVLSQAQLSGLTPPSTAQILGSLLGKWAEYFVNVGVMISILVLAGLDHSPSGVALGGAKDGTYPKIFATTNVNGSASVSLWVSTAVMQVAMILVYFSNNAWNVMLSITGVMILPAYIGSTGIFGS